MNAATHVSGNIYPDKAALRAFKHMLAFIGIRVAHPLADGPFLYRHKWQRYEAEVEYYKTIADSAFYIVYCDNEIDEQAGLQLIYAMLKRRPVIMTGEPVFAPGLSLFARDVIGRRLGIFHRIRLDEFELVELSLLLRTRRPGHYGLTDGEIHLIKSRLKAYFRDIASGRKQ